MPVKKWPTVQTGPEAKDYVPPVGGNQANKPREAHLIKYELDMKVFYCIFCSRERGRNCPLLRSMGKADVFVPLDVADHRDAAISLPIKTSEVITYEVESRREGEPRFTSYVPPNVSSRAGLGLHQPPVTKDSLMYVKGFQDGSLKVVTVLKNFISIADLLPKASSRRDKKISRGLALGKIRPRGGLHGVQVFPCKRVDRIVNPEDPPRRHFPPFMWREKYARFKNQLERDSRNNGISLVKAHYMDILPLSREGIFETLPPARKPALVLVRRTEYVRYVPENPLVWVSDRAFT